MKTRQDWLTDIGEGTYKPKPPTSWIEQQEADGRKGPMVFAIWHQRYTAARKMTIWAVCEDWEFTAAGMHLYV